MINMRMRDQDKIKILWAIGLHFAITLFYGLIALMHAAVNSKTPTTGFNNIARTGDGARSTQKLDFHQLFSAQDPVCKARGENAASVIFSVQSER